MSSENSEIKIDSDTQVLGMRVKKPKKAAPEKTEVEQIQDDLSSLKLQIGALEHKAKQKVDEARELLQAVLEEIQSLGPPKAVKDRMALDKLFAERRLLSERITLTQIELFAGTKKTRTEIQKKQIKLERAKLRQQRGALRVLQRMEAKKIRDEKKVLRSFMKREEQEAKKKYNFKLACPHCKRQVWAHKLPVEFRVEPIQQKKASAK